MLGAGRSSTDSFLVVFSQLTYSAPWGEVGAQGEMGREKAVPCIVSRHLATSQGLRGFHVPSGMVTVEKMSYSKNSLQVLSNSVQVLVCLHCFSFNPAFLVHFS